MSISPYQWAGLLIIPLILAVGQILFKTASGDATVENVLRLFANPYLWAALFLYGAATIGWLFVIRGLPISRAIMFIALSYVYVPLLSALFLGERLSLKLFLGVAIICTGVYVSATA